MRPFSTSTADFATGGKTRDSAWPVIMQEAGQAASRFLVRFGCFESNRPTIELQLVFPIRPFLQLRFDQTLHRLNEAGRLPRVRSLDRFVAAA